MNKKIFSIVIFIILSFLLNSCNNNQTNEGIIEYSDGYLDNIEKELEEENNKNDSKEANKRLEELRKKIELKGLITRGDLYFSNKEYTTALTQYLQVYRNVPGDKEVNKKIGDIYYKLGNYSRAYEFYSNIKDYPQIDKKIALYSYINSVDITNTGSIREINNEIDSFNFSEQDNFYYKNSITCTQDFSLCRQKFQDFFQKIEEDNNNEDNTTKIELNENLETINNAFVNYENFQIDDLVYKAALISGAYYQNGFYKVALETSKNILNENKGYKPVLKIAAKSAYELGNYIEARDFLIEYNKIETKDPEMSYFTGRVYEKLNEYVLSVIHFSKAINIGYSDIEDIKRRLIFIYFEIDDREKMLKTFRELVELESDKLNIRDFHLAVYYHIINGDLDNAAIISEKAKTKFKESEIFYGYHAWIMLQKEEISTIQERIIETNIKKGIDINPENPMIQMVNGIYQSKKENYEDALKSFKKSLDLDKNREYQETIEYWIDQTLKKMNNKK